MKSALFVLVAAIVCGVCSGCDFVRLSKNDRQLLIASGVGDTQAVRALLDQGADVNVRSFDGRKMTPLLWAVSQSHWETACLLIERGANVRAVDIGKISVGEYARDGKDDPKSAQCLEMIESRLNRPESQPPHGAP